MQDPEDPATPETGAVRFNEQGQVEHFDGAAWVSYRELPDAGGTPLFRGDDAPAEDTP
ncbi:hypothetical protein [Streptomyces sp. NPDC102476]|uniref:hypothetical protein n=1 Tax=Streptomyces sp. NPDC102476 TaxID=3366181 RepID=UPI003825D4C7